MADIKENLFETVFKDSPPFRTSPSSSSSSSVSSSSSSKKSSRDRVRRALRTVSTLKTIAEKLNRRVQNHEKDRKESERKIIECYERRIKDLDPSRLEMMNMKIEEQRIKIERLEAREEEMRIREQELETCSKSFEQCLSKIEENQRLQNEELIDLRSRVNKSEKLHVPTRRLVRVVTAHLDGVPTSRLRAVLQQQEEDEPQGVDTFELLESLINLNDRISGEVAHSIGNNCTMQ